MVELAPCTINDEVDDVNLHNFKVLLPKLTPSKKGKYIISTSKIEGQPLDVPPIEQHMVGPP